MGRLFVSLYRWVLTTGLGVLNELCQLHKADAEGLSNAANGLPLR